ncbi:hypothetical protein LEP1GSC082_4627 [Leptospira kirschneri str. H2]|uniref:Uncharacterized protein n=1 Tax=Leptospira kirschneri str. H1 TaxID=1049966 RepID=A0A0E2B527_9LEPT|nr:hypothetical protein LEP1GSC081_2447 [Leptospira kirschneri str. H1]EKO62484.1 hypothetical protein LEP1GSC082_4627 [Leptospira kirschneri str. H2]
MIKIEIRIKTVLQKITNPLHVSTSNRVEKKSFSQRIGANLCEIFLSFDFLSSFIDSIVRNFLQMAISKTDLGFQKTTELK